jgi:putative nucleotidyltransferase with HDIG domain
MKGKYYYLKRVRVYTDELQVGMRVGELDIDWDDSDFVFQGFEVKNQQYIEALQARCKFVYVDFPTEKSYKLFLRNRVKVHDVKLEKVTPLAVEVNQAKTIFVRSDTTIKDILKRVALEQDFSSERATQSIKSCVDSILRNEDALLILSQIKNQDEYTAEHCLRVAIISIAFARFLKMKRSQLIEVGLCGLLHDVGKMKVPDEILNKPAKLTPEEFEAMKGHAVKGYQILVDKKNLSDSIANVALSHHEQVNGNGYPNQIRGTQISRLSRLIAIVDTYDAVTSARVYDKARAPMDAFKILLDNRDQHYDERLVTQFIEWMGVYPAGSIVEMKSGEIGIVIKVNKAQKLKPKVIFLTDAQKAPIKNRIVDLSKLHQTEDKAQYQVAKTLPDGSYGIQLSELLRKGLNISW